MALDRRQPHRPRAFLAVFTALTAVSACRSDNTRPEAYSVRDSLGIQIVETHVDRTELPEWVIGDLPLLSIGTVEGAEEYRFHWISGGLRMPDGSIVITNGGSSEVRFYNAEGRFVRSVGGVGDGPGEYRFPQGIWALPGDTLVVWDDRLRRMSYLTGEGRFVRTASPSPTVRAPTAIQVRPDGSWIMQHIQYTVGTTDFAMGSLVLLRFDSVGGLTDSIAALPWGELKDMGPWAAGRVFGARGSAASGLDVLWYGESTRYEVAQLDDRGDTKRIIRWSGPDRAVSQADADAYWDQQIQRQGGNAGAIETLNSMREKQPVADQFPAYQNLHVDVEGCLWAKDYNRPGAEESVWTVVAPDGRVLATVPLPRDTHLLEAGENYVLVVDRDELEVEYVRVYPLQRAPAKG